MNIWNRAYIYSREQNVKTAEPIGPKFFVGPRLAPGKVYEWPKFQKFASNKIWFH